MQSTDCAVLKRILEKDEELIEVFFILKVNAFEKKCKVSTKYKGFELTTTANIKNIDSRFNELLDKNT